MSTFSGISTALSSIQAQRRALEVTGQNIANVNTPGHTRQRADLTSAAGVSVPSMFSTQGAAGNGVRVTGITRMADSFLDTRVRAETGASAFGAGRAAVLTRLEGMVTEPGDHGLAAGMAKLWAGWQDVANNPAAPAARKVLLGDANALVAQVASGYGAVDQQWTQMRTETATLVTEVNAAAASVADLNQQIRSMQASGSTPNELMDQRDALVTTLSGLVGAHAREREDGTVDVMVAGNALVRGDRSNPLAVSGSFTMAGGIGEPPGAVDPVRLSWAANGRPVALDGGRLASHVSALAPAAGGGVLASAAASWNAVAVSLRDTVNAIHTAGRALLPAPDDTGGEFFASAAGRPAALGLSVAITDPAAVAAGDPAKGPLDGSFADRISQIGASPDGPDALWRAFAVDIGVQARAAGQRASSAEASRASAENLQRSQAGVDLDEESVNMLTHQRAYEGAARVLTAIDEMLDVLINRTGVVGR